MAISTPSSSRRADRTKTHAKKNKSSPLHDSLVKATSTLPASILSLLALEIDVILASHATPKSYTIYPPLLLFPPGSFASKEWQALLSHLDGEGESKEELKEKFWGTIAKGMHVDCLAINAPIPASLKPEPSLREPSNEEVGQNLRRLPTQIHPLYGQFGPLPTASTITNPTTSDFSAALWVQATQNGIHQTWAPMYTMFSRGNITEKTRILTGKLPGLGPGDGTEERQISVVDLYVGIGYFAFCYLGNRRVASTNEKVCRVWGWELSGWSVEGCRRGAEANKWGCRAVIAKPKEQSEGTHQNSEMLQELESIAADEKKDLVVFQEDNVHASSRIHALKSLTIQKSKLWRPVRHVNLGLLPTSRDSWQTAVQVLDEGLGGWVHAHENLGVGEIEKRRGEVERIFGNLAESDGRKAVEVKVVNGVKVKSWAPGVVHWIWDVWVPAQDSSIDSTF